MAGTRKCVFFDRDGVVNESPGPGYVERWSDFKLLPEFVDSLRAVKAAGYEAVIVTNQHGVGRGIMSPEALESIHRNLTTVLKDRYGLELKDILHCPHGDDECDCRKPKPGLLMEAARRHGLNLKESWMIGDSAGDILAGKAAGCRTVFVGHAEGDEGSDYRVGEMSELAALLERMLQNGRETS